MELEIIGELMEKFKKNNKLSKTDSHQARELILEQLKLKHNSKSVFEMILLFHSDTGIAAFSEFLLHKNEDIQKESIYSFLNFPEFIENRNGKSLRRGLALSCNLFQNKYNRTEIFSILVSLCKMTINSQKKGLSKKVAEIFANEMYGVIDKSFFQINLAELNLKENDFDVLAQLLIHTINQSGERYTLTLKQQMDTLNLLSTLGKKIYLDKEHEALFVKQFVSWTEEARSEALNSGLFTSEVQTVLASNHNNLKNDKENSGVITSVEKSINNNDKVRGNAKNSTNESYQNQTSLKNKRANEPIDKTIYRILKDMQTVRNELKCNQEDQNSLNINLKYYRDEYQIIKSKFEERESEIKRLIVENRKFQDMIQQLNSKLIISFEQNDQQTNEISDLQNSMKTLHAAYEVKENNSIEEFKNKLGNQVRGDYLDFLDLNDSDTEDELSKILLFQLKNIFGLLIRNGVDPS